MKLCLNVGSILARTGGPLQGMVRVFLHDSDELATVYTLEGGDFVQAANPQLLDNNARMQTLYFEAGFVDVEIRKYIGPEGYMSVSSPDTEFESFDRFSYGFDMGDGNAVHAVDTITDLKDVDVSMGVVLVRGYYALGDSPARYYIWDENSNDSSDGGYVIESNGDAAGKWILCWGDEVLPCTVYGVKPGTEANLAAFLDYPALVGSMSLKTAPCLRFVAGTYSTGGSLATNRTLCFDTGAQFVNGPTFNCTEVRTLGPVTGYIADFKFGSSNNGDAVAHSSWFKTLKAFWTCKADRLEIDDTNYFTALNIDEGVTVANAIITGSKRIPATYTANSGYLRFDSCVFEAFGIFNPTLDYVRLVGMRKFPRDIWTAYTAASFDFGTVPTNHTQYKRSGDLNIIDVDDFGDAGIFIKCALANGDTELDLRGNTAQGFESSAVTTIKSAKFETAVTLHTNGITLENFEGSLNVDAGATIAATNCSLQVNGNPASMTLKNVALTSLQAFDPKKTYINMECGSIDSGFAMSDTDIDDGTKVNKSTFHGVNIGAGSVWKTNDIECVGCTIQRVIGVYPYLDSGTEKVSLLFSGNRLVGLALISVRNPPTREAASVVAECFKVFKNSFEQNDTYGIEAPYYGNGGGYFWADVLDGYAQTLYQGNTGNCLKGPSYIACGLMSGTYTSGADTVYYGGEFGYFNLTSYGRYTSRKNGLLRATNYGTTQGFSVTGFADLQFVHKAMIDPTDNNIFKVYYSWSSDEGYDSTKTLVSVD